MRMMEEKPVLQEQAQIMNFSYRDAKKLVSRIWNEEDLLNKKRGWLIGTSTLPTIDGRHRKSKRPKFLTDMCLAESLVRNDEVSYETLRINVEKSFGAFGDTQRRHHVVQNYLEFFDNMEICSKNLPYFLQKFYSAVNDLSNRALCLVTMLITDQKVCFEKTRPRMKKIIKCYLPQFIEKSNHNFSLRPLNELSQIFRDPGNFRKKQLTVVTPVTASILISIQNALKEVDEMSFRDLAAMNRKFRVVTFVPKFPPAYPAGKRELLLQRLKKRCQKVLLILKEGSDLPKSFAKALSIVILSVKHKTKCADIFSSEFYHFSADVVGLQNDILRALWTLPKVKTHELKALQPVLDPNAQVAMKTFRTALRNYLLEFLFECDGIEIPEELSSILASLNRRSRRQPRLFSVGVTNEDVESVLRVSSQLKSVVSDLLPDDKTDEVSDTPENVDDSEGNDFDLNSNHYLEDLIEQGPDSHLNDEAEEGTGESSFASCSPGVAHRRHSQQHADVYINGGFVKKESKLEQVDCSWIATDQSHSPNLREFSAVGGFTKKTHILEYDDDGSTSSHHPVQASVTGNFIKKLNMGMFDDNNPSQHCPEETLSNGYMRESLIQETCDDTSLVAYKLIGRMVDNFLHIEGRRTDEMTRYYLRGGSSALESPGSGDKINFSEEDVGAHVLVQSVEELLPSLSKSCVERVKRLMRQPNS